MTKDGARPKVVILNDTSSRAHHGCSRVMRLMRAGLERHGLDVIATSLARNKWADDALFLGHLEYADLIVINGEGTLHHGRPAGQVLLDVIDQAIVLNCPVALINALYQDNPPEWGQVISRCDLLSARDERSAKEMQNASGSDTVRCVPDMSLSAGSEAVAGDRTEIVIGDSVRLNMRRQLALLAVRVKAQKYLPIKTLKSWIFRAPFLGPLSRWVLFNVYNGVIALRQPQFLLAQTEADYINAISRAKIHLTGRFHSVCLSLATGTPFLAVTSNSWKIEALLDDIGLGRDRVVVVDQLSELGSNDLDRPFTPSEAEMIGKYLQTAREKSEALFSDLAALAFGRSSS